MVPRAISVVRILKSCTCTAFARRWAITIAAATIAKLSWLERASNDTLSKYLLVDDRELQTYT